MTTRPRFSLPPKPIFLKYALTFLLLLLVSAGLFSLPDFFASRAERRLYRQYEDPPFDKTGIVSLPELGPAAGLLSLDDGTSLVGGPVGEEALSRFALLRLSPDGSRDPKFGDKGVAFLGLRGQEPFLALARQEQRILALANCETSPCIARVDAQTGKIDSSFGEKGRAEFATPHDIARAFVVDKSGKIYVAGSVPQGKEKAFSLWRLDSQGRRDPLFAGGGQALARFGNGRAEAYAMALEPGGKTVVGGYFQQGATLAFALARFTDRGQLDATFGNEGRVVAAFQSASNYLYSLLVQEDGKILVTGASGAGSGYDFALARFLPDGRPDSSFGLSGMTLVPIGARDDVARSLVLLPNQKFLLVGSSEIAQFHHGLVVSRFLPTGAFDSRFGTEGVTLIEGEYSPLATSLQPNGKLLVSGQLLTPDGRSQGFVARFTLQGGLDGS